MSETLPTQTIQSADPVGPTATAAHVFVVFDCKRPLAPSARYSLRGRDRIVIGREAPSTDDTSELGIKIDDREMSREHALLISEGSRWYFEDTSKNGSRVGGSEVKKTRVPIDDGALVELGNTFLLFRDALGVDFPESVAAVEPADDGFATLLPELNQRFRRLQKVAQSHLSLIIHGETGTGKEVIARAIHERSGRSGSFQAINCGAIPQSLIESMLFGHKKGAFSGATEDRDGVIRSADKGTLLLDEIGDMPLDSQVKLLRVLQQKEVVPLGATRPIPVDVRVVAASHRNLREMAQGGAFRPDLLARIGSYQIDLPPLRERREDLGLLVSALLRRMKAFHPDQTFSRSAARELFERTWPGNIRELEQALEASLVLADGAQVSQLPPQVLPERQASPTRKMTVQRPLDEEEAAKRDQVLRALREHTGNVSKAAEALDMHRRQLQRLMKRFAIDPKQTK